MQVWEDRARSWLSSLPGHRSPSAAEMDAWVDSDPSILPEELNAVPRSELHQRILSVHGLLAGPSQVEGDDRAEEGPRGRFQRAEHWNPVYSWLESLDTNEVVQAKDIKDWFLANPDIKENLAKNSRYHLMHYIQRVHMKILRRQGKIQKKGGQNCNTRTSVKIPNNGLRARGVPIPCKFSSKMSEDKEVSLFKKNEAFLRYELLTELQNQLTSLLSKHNHVNDLKESCSPALLRQRSVENLNHRSSDFDEEKENIGAILGQASHLQYVENFCANRQSKLGSSLDLMARLKRKRNVGVVAHAWSYCEALSGPIDDPSSSLKCEGTREKYIGIQDVDSESLQKSSSCKAVALSKKNIIKCLQGRERGISWPLACSHGGYVGRSQEKWIPFFEGWKSLGRQFEGPAVWLGRRSCSSWIPTWCAYTSSVAVAQPFGRLDVIDYQS